MLDFKLEYYFYKYRNSIIIPQEEFKKEFTKANGEFKYLSELIIMIQKYQIKKYGNLLTGTVPYVDNEKISKNDAKRIYQLYGNKEKRNKNKIEYDRRQK